MALAAVALAGCGVPPAWQGRGNPRLADYQRAFDRDAGRRWDGSASLADAAALLNGCRVLWLGDHHRDRALHRRQLELLELLARRGAQLVFGLEAVGTQDDAAVAAFLAGRGELDALAASIRRRWPDSWLDGDHVDSAHYRALLRLARRTASPVFGLEPTPRLPLPQRDAEMAARVRLWSTLHPDRLLVIVVGQAHLVGDGRLAERARLPCMLLGAVPPPELRAAAAPPIGRGRGDLWRSDAGMWFFADLTPPGP